MGRRPKQEPTDRLAPADIEKARSEIAERVKRFARTLGKTNLEIAEACGRSVGWIDGMMYSSKLALDSIIEIAPILGVHVADLLAEPSYSELALRSQASADPVDPKVERRAIGDRVRALQAERQLSPADAAVLAGHDTAWASSITSSAIAGLDALIEMAGALEVHVADFFTDSPRYSEATAWSEGEVPWEVKDRGVSIIVWADDAAMAIEKASESMFGRALGKRASASKWPQVTRSASWQTVIFEWMPVLRGGKRTWTARSLGSFDGDIQAVYPGPTIASGGLELADLDVLAGLHRRRHEGKPQRPFGASNADLAESMERLAASRLVDRAKATEAASTAVGGSVRLTEKHREALEVFDRLAIALERDPSTTEVGLGMTPTVSRARASKLLRQARGLE